MTLVPTTPTTPAQLVETVAALEEHNALLTEAVADLEIAAEDRGWKALGAELDRELSREGLAVIGRNCEVMAIASPLVKRGLQLRNGYVWGQGVTLQARATGGTDDAGQDVNAVLQDFLDDPINRAAFSGLQAREQSERTLGTKGNLVFTLFPNPLTGVVQIRRTPFEEITDKITNPDDREDVWFYSRTYTVSVLEAGYTGTTRRRRETRRVLHPAMGFWPATRPRTVDNLPVLWDQPMLHVAVNRPDAAKWGIPDAYAALPWARAYDGFLTDWAKLVKALSKFAWKLTGDRSSKTQRAMGRLRGLSVPGGPEGTAPALGAGPGAGMGESPAGGVAGMGPGQNLEAIPKTGATIDSESGRPLAAMVAAALGIPVTTLLADPGTTGARAVAETLDKPTILEMNGRRELWTSVLTDIAGFVVDQAIRAPRGPLTGTVIRDQSTGVETVTLAGGAQRTIVVDWPDLNELDPVQLVTAIAAADSTGKMPPVETLRLLLSALRVRDADEIIERVTDENGEFIDPALAAAAAAIADQRRRGRDTTPGTPKSDAPPANDSGEPAEDA